MEILQRKLNPKYGTVRADSCLETLQDETWKAIQVRLKPGGRVVANLGNLEAEEDKLTCTGRQALAAMSRVFPEGLKFSQLLCRLDVRKIYDFNSCMCELEFSFKSGFLLRPLERCKLYTTFKSLRRISFHKCSRCFLWKEQMFA